MVRLRTDYQMCFRCGGSISTDTLLRITIMKKFDRFDPIRLAMVIEGIDMLSYKISNTEPPDLVELARPLLMLILRLRGKYLVSFQYASDCLLFSE